MAERGTRLRLAHKLGPAAAVAHSTGTPGFGVDTPSFPGGCSGRTSAFASNGASAASSTPASPRSGGQMSPWLLEAEALLADSDDGTPRRPPRPGPAPATAWAVPPGWLAEIPEAVAAAPARAAPEALHAADDDELEQVCLFTAPTHSLPAQTVAPAQTGGRSGEALGPAQDGRGGRGGQARPMEQPDKEGPEEVGSVAPVYATGEMVFYWSGTRSCWLPARVMERRHYGIYVVDKQLKGCRSKVPSWELVSEVELQRDPVLHPLDLLERAADAADADAAAAAAAAATGAARSAAGRTAPRAAAACGGRVVRADFSDDSDG